MNGKVEDIAGYAVQIRDAVSCVGEMADWIERAPAGSPCRWMACLNPHSYAVALTDPAFSTALKQADWLIPDGAGVVLASRILGGRVRGRITGCDVFEGLCTRLDRKRGFSVFFLGSTEATLVAIRERLAREYPEVRVAGTYSPPYKPLYTEQELDSMIATINAAAPDVLWVGMTAPKQEKWIYHNRGRLKVKFAAAIGAVFDFYGGRIKRTHPILRRMGLEWLPRLLQEPRRLWRRTFVSAPIFLWHVFRAALNREAR